MKYIVTTNLRQFEITSDGYVMALAIANSQCAKDETVIRVVKKSGTPGG